MKKNPEHIFSRRAVEKLSWFKGEPAWMTDMRLAAWDRFEKAEAASPSGILLDEIYPFREPPRKTIPSHEWPKELQHAMDERGDEEGLIIHRDSTVLSRAITKEQTKKGVIFTDLDSAVKSVPELVRNYLSSQVPPEDAFSALNAAFWSGGSFLYVPEHVDIKLAFHTCYWMSMPGTGLFPHTLIVLERGAAVSFIDEFVSSSMKGLSFATVEMVVGEKARLRYFTIENWGAGVYHTSQQQARVAPTGQLRCFHTSGHRPIMTLERVAELHPEVRA